MENSTSSGFTAGPNSKDHPAVLYGILDLS
jgi:hypothetical protein